MLHFALGCILLTALMLFIVLLPSTTTQPLSLFWDQLLCFTSCVNMAIFTLYC